MSTLILSKGVLLMESGQEFMMHSCKMLSLNISINKLSTKNVLLQPKSSSPRISVPYMVVTRLATKAIGLLKKISTDTTFQGIFSIVHEYSN